MESDDLLTDPNKQPTQPSPNESIINNISISTDTPNTKNGKLSSQKDDKRRFMAKYLDIDVPAVLVTDLDSYEKKGWREPGADQSDYFNYGYNEMLYKLYIERIKSRLVDLKTKIDLKQIELNNDKSLKKYLFSFPSDFGGIGDILNGNQYENVRLFEPNNNEGRTIPILEHQQGRFIYNIDKNLSNEMPTNYIPQHVHYHNNFPRMPNAPIMDMRIPMPHFNFYDPMAFGIPNFPGHPHGDEEVEKKEKKKKEKKDKKSKKYKSKRSRRSSSYSRSYSRSRSRHRNKRRSDSRNKSEVK